MNVAGVRHLQFTRYRSCTSRPSLGFLADVQVVSPHTSRVLGEVDLCAQLDSRLRIQRERRWLTPERQSNEATTGKLLRLGGPRQRAKIHEVVPETAMPLDTENSGGLGAITAHGASWWWTAKVTKVQVWESTIERHDGP